MDEQQLETANSMGGAYQPVIMPSDKADLMDKIDPTLIVDIIKFQLMGYEYNKSKMEWEQKQKKGLTPLGAAELCTLMLSVSSKNVSISQLKDDEIRERTKNIHKEAMRMCIRNWKQYGITGADQVGMISQIVVSNTFITLKQPENSGIIKLLMGTTSEVRSIQEAPKKEGMLSGIFRR